MKANRKVYIPPGGRKGNFTYNTSYVKQIIKCKASEMTWKKILIINGHPDKESFNFGLAEAYKKGAVRSGAEVKVIAVSEINFNPN